MAIHFRNGHINTDKRTIKDLTISVECDGSPDADQLFDLIVKCCDEAMNGSLAITLHEHKDIVLNS